MDTHAPASGLEVLRGAAHLLRTPLGVVLGTATTLRDYDARFTPPQRVKYLGEVVRAAEEMKAALDGLSLLGRTLDRSLTFNLEPVPLPEVVATCEAALKGVWVETPLPAGSASPGAALVDMQRLGQAVEALARAVRGVNGTRIEAGIGSAPFLEIGPVHPEPNAVHVLPVLTDAVEGFAMAETLAGPAGWPLMLVRRLLDAQGASVHILPDGDETVRIRINLAPTGH